MSNSMLLAIWACGDQIFTGIMAGEAASPRHSMAHAAKLVPIRVTVIIMLMVTFATLLVPSNDPRLFGGSGVTASPFVIALMDAGIPVLPDILNAVLLIGIVAIGAESIYLSSRMLRALAHQGLIHKSIAAIDSRGIPRVSIAITMAVAYILTYANLSCMIPLPFLLSLSPFPSEPHLAFHQQFR
jgi:amino acid transporter